MSAIAVVEVSNPEPSLRSDFALESEATHDEITLNAIRRLRYEVYCLERGFVAMDDCPDALEGDQFDAHATHFAGEDGSGQLVATVRLVRHSPLGFPLERHAGRLFPEFHRMPYSRTAEISRLIVDKRHRRDTLRDPRLLLGLLLQVCEESLRAGVECLLAAMEQSLWRLLQQHGIVWTPVGGPMHYFGEVVPYWSSLERLRKSYDRLAADLSAVPAPFRYLRVPVPARGDPRARPAPICGVLSPL